MKIKSDFVTNSSSAAMMVFIPKNYDLELNEIRNTDGYKEFLEMDTPNKNEIAELEDKIIKEIDCLKSGQETYAGPYGMDGAILLELLRESDLVLKSIDVDGEGATTIVPMSLLELKQLSLKALKANTK